MSKNNVHKKRNAKKKKKKKKGKSVEKDGHFDPYSKGHSYYVCKQIRKKFNTVVILQWITRTDPGLQAAFYQPEVLAGEMPVSPKPRNSTESMKTFVKRSMGAVVDRKKRGEKREVVIA